MAVFGKCIDRKHTTCEKKIQRWYHGHTGVGRNRKSAIIYLEEYLLCDCKCHKPKPIRTRRKTKTK